MTSFTVQGYVSTPTRSDAPGVYGYDNGGYFGTQFASLGDLPFSVTWTGTGLCNCYGGLLVPANLGGPISPITGATLTIGNITVDILSYGGVSEGEWLDQVLQVQTTWSLTSSTPPFATTLYGSQNSLTTWLDGRGAFILHDINHQFQTNAFLTVTNWGDVPVPGPIIGTGLPGLLAMCLLFIVLKRRKVFR